MRPGVGDDPIWSTRSSRGEFTGAAVGVSINSWFDGLFAATSCYFHCCMPDSVDASILHNTGFGNCTHNQRPIRLGFPIPNTYNLATIKSDTIRETRSHPETLPYYHTVIPGSFLLLQGIFHLSYGTGSPSNQSGVSLGGPPYQTFRRST